jgi:hypothetical protein
MGAGLALGVVGLVLWPYIFPPNVDIQTLCRHINKSVPRSHCTVAAAPAAFPVGNIIDVGPKPDPLVPLPPTLRELVKSCWIDKNTADSIQFVRWRISWPF